MKTVNESTVLMVEPSFQIFLPDLVAAFPALLEIDWFIIIKIYGVTLKIAVEIGGTGREPVIGSPSKVIKDLYKYLMPPPQLHVFSVAPQVDPSTAGLPLSSHIPKNTPAASLLSFLLKTAREMYIEADKLEEDSEFNNYLNISLLYSSSAAMTRIAGKSKARIIVFGNKVTRRKWNILYPQHSNQQIHYVEMEEHPEPELAETETDMGEIVILTPYLPPPMVKKAARSIRQWLQSKPHSKKRPITVIDTGLKESAEAADHIKKEMETHGYNAKRRTVEPKTGWMKFAEEIGSEETAEIIIISEFPKEAVVSIVKKWSGKQLYIVTPRLTLNRRFKEWLEKAEKPKDMIENFKAKFTVKYSVINAR